MTKVKQLIGVFHGLKTRGKFQKVTVEFDATIGFDSEYTDIPIEEPQIEKEIEALNDIIAQNVDDLEAQNGQMEVIILQMSIVIEDLRNQYNQKSQTNSDWQMIIKEQLGKFFNYIENV